MKKPILNYKEAKKLITKYKSPLYVYKKSIIKDRYQSLKRAFVYPKTKIFYAAKQNTNIEILKFLKKLGANIETVSPEEIKKALSSGFKKNEISFTCSNISEHELRWVIKQGVQIHLDSLNQIEWYGKIKPNTEISVRFNLDFGDGGHNHLITGGPNSKFGVFYKKLPEVKKLCQKYNLKVVGLHQHVGTSILRPSTFIKATNKIINFAINFPDLKSINLGGGFGVPYKPTDKPLDVESLGKNLSEKFIKLSKKYNRKIGLHIEPGRFIVAESGALLATVTDIKSTSKNKFVGIDTGFNHLIRPILYGAYHHVFNLSNLNGKKERVSVVGNICESADFLATKRDISRSKIGDILLLADVGASGYVMSSWYNSRNRPKEIVI